MLNGHDTARAVDALHAIPPDCDRAAWVKTGMAFHAAGGDFDTFDQWSAGADSYNAQACRATWRSFKTAPGGVTAGALFGMARDAGWQDGNTSPYEAPTKGPARATRTPEPRKQPAKGNTPAEVWARLEAVKSHDYCERKQLPDPVLNQLRVVADTDPLTQYRGWLAVPGYDLEGTLQTIEFVAPDGQKRTLTGTQKAGAIFIAGPTDGPIVVCEGLATAGSVFCSTGLRAISTFGCGNTRRIVEALRQKEPDARIIIAPDRGKEPDAQKIAAELGCAVACLPESWPNNADLNDVFCRDGFDVVANLLEAATEPPKPAPRYKLLNRDDLAALPALTWRVRGVLPAVGLAGLYGPSASGKSFLAFDMAASIADGERWFDCRVEAAPVVYAALEGEAGFKLRAQAWEAHNARTLPDGLHMILQPFRLTSPQDVSDFAAVIPAGAVVFIDTLNRAAPTANENDSADMGLILESAKRLQALTAGLVVLIHHTGKDATKGLRGHSSLFAAMDAAVEVSRDGDRREWRCAKSKDGADGDAHPFKLEIKTLGMDAYGDPVTSCVVRADTSAADIQRVKLPQGGNQRLVYEGIRGLFKDGHTGKPGAPSLRPCIELEAAVAAGAARLTCQSDRRATRTREAITGLVSRGVLGLNEGWLWTV